MGAFVFYILSYLIGNFMTAYVLVKYVYQKDIRELGSGNVGARNAGRVYGKGFFIVTFLGDAFKGAIVILMASYYHFSPEVQLLGLSFAVIGHVKPIFLRFNGGKGVSTFIGGALAFEPRLAVVMIIAFILTYPFIKSFTKSGLGSFLFIPITLFMLGNSIQSVLVVTVMVVFILLAHDSNHKGSD